MATINVETSRDTLRTLPTRRPSGSVLASVRHLLEREAATLTAKEPSDRERIGHQARAIAARSSVTADDVVAAIAEMRERHT